VSSSALILQVTLGTVMTAIQVKGLVDADERTPHNHGFDGHSDPVESGLPL
jgi:hypothetical protein